MAADLPDNALELRSLVTSAGTLELSLHEVPVPTPGAERGAGARRGLADQPVRPGSAHRRRGHDHGDGGGHAGTSRRHRAAGSGALAGLSARLDKSLPVGNEGAGTVVAAGSSAAAQALLGKTVGIAGGAMYSQYRAVDAPHVWSCPKAPRPGTAHRPSSIR